MIRARRAHYVFGWLVLLAACGDDDNQVVPIDSGIDALVVQPEAGTAPTCGANTCGSPLVGQHCCTAALDVGAGVALAPGRCGVSLELLVPTLAGECVELRQPGTLDNTCSARAAGGVLEPGCCMPDGVCGTYNGAADLGCQRVLTPQSPVVACGVSSMDAGHEPDAD